MVHSDGMLYTLLSIDYERITMRCRSCDEALTDYESTRKSLATGDYINLCRGCFDTIKGECLAFGNPSLMTEDDDQYSLSALMEDQFDSLDDDGFYDEYNDRD
jgi:hypothetical protein